ncbi:hypothetical protein C0J52_10887 [Blattella germanica]|nr:hypothetical protein C0J52_10887 [Blattella germanica]
MDAMRCIAKAWNRVTAKTIQNCFRHAGISSTEERNAAETEDMFDDCEDNLPLSTFLRNINSEIPSDCDYDMYAIIDDDLITTEVQTEDKIVSEVKNKGHSDHEEEEEQDDKEEKNKVPVPTGNFKEGGGGEDPGRDGLTISRRI